MDILNESIQAQEGSNLQTKITDRVGWNAMWTVEKRPVDVHDWILPQMKPSELVVPMNISDRGLGIHFLRMNDPEFQKSYDALREEFDFKVGLEDKLVVHGNALCTNGFTDIWTGISTTGLGTPYTNANAALGVGDSSASNGTPCVWTNLQASSNRVRAAMNATYPTVATNIITFNSDFTGANFHWQEVAAFNNVTDPSGHMLNRLVTDLGTKSSGSTWTLTLTITLT